MRDIGGVSVDEVSKFENIAESWWDKNGKFWLLHELNPVRLHYIRDKLADHFSRDLAKPRPFSGLSLLDIGCGGGLLAEPMARLGFTVVGIDAAKKNIRIASSHAEEVDIHIDYRHMTVEHLVGEQASFDVVLNMEVVEHVVNQSLFLRMAATLVTEHGLMIVSTLNRTLKSLILAKIGAEYILHWLPAGTHDWRKFLRPAELAYYLRQSGLHVAEMQGITYAPIVGQWYLSDDCTVNYFMVARCP